MDFSKFSNEDLLALKKKDYKKLSNEALLALKAQTIQKPTQPQAQDPGIMDSIRNTLKPVSDAVTNFKQSPAYSTSPVGMLEKVPEVISKGADVAGTMVAEQMGREGADPRLAAGVGTAVSMGPDIAMAGINPMQGANVALPQGAKSLARRSLGLQKRFLNTPFARGQAQKAAEVALQNDVIPAFGNPQKALDNATALANKSGQGLEKMRASVGRTPIDRVFDELGRLRMRLVKGRTGGVWDAANAKINEAVDSLQGLLNQGNKISLNDVVEAKTRIKGATNFLSDLTTQKDTKQIVRAIETGISNIMGEKGVPMRLYRALKRDFGAAKLMQTGLNNELALQQGNDLVSLSGKLAAMIPGGGALTAPLKAGVMELAKRRGAAMGARVIKSAAGAQRQVSPLINALLTRKRKEQ